MAWPEPGLFCSAPVDQYFLENFFFDSASASASDGEVPAPGGASGRTDSPAGADSFVADPGGVAAAGPADAADSTASTNIICADRRLCLRSFSSSGLRLPLVLACSISS